MSETKGNEEYLVQKTKWGEGPWQAEPDKVEWRHLGLPCLIVRNGSGALCGYVGVPPTHPLHGVGYNEETPVLKDALAARMEKPLGETPSMAVMLGALLGDMKPRLDTVFDVHGGLTYSDKCRGEICHMPAPGEADDVWWLGFDCGHAGDYIPRHRGIGGDVYRDVAYVKAEVERLAVQILAVVKG